MKLFNKSILFLAVGSLIASCANSEGPGFTDHDGKPVDNTVTSGKNNIITERKLDDIRSSGGSFELNVEGAGKFKVDIDNVNDFMANGLHTTKESDNGDVRIYVSPGSELDYGHYGLAGGVDGDGKVPMKGFSFVSNPTRGLDQMEGTVTYSGSAAGWNEKGNKISTSGRVEMEIDFTDGNFKGGISGDEDVFGENGIDFKGKISDDRLVGNAQMGDDGYDGEVEAQFAGKNADELFGHYNGTNSNNDHDYSGSFGGSKD